MLEIQEQFDSLNDRLLQAEANCQSFKTMKRTKEQDLDVAKIRKEDGEQAHSRVDGQKRNGLSKGLLNVAPEDQQQRRIRHGQQQGAEEVETPGSRPPETD